MTFDMFMIFTMPKMTLGTLSVAQDHQEHLSYTTWTFTSYSITSAETEKEVVVGVFFLAISLEKFSWKTILENLAG